MVASAEAFDSLDELPAPLKSIAKALEMQLVSTAKHLAVS